MIDLEILKNSTLSWLDSLKLSGHNCRYRFSTDSGDTIFCSCFALFILDLFGETENFSEKERQNWISYIQNFQNKEFGYFEPEQYYHEDKERNCYQLTCFCLSALGILKAEPEFPLKFIERWKTPDDIKKYLYDRGCHEGKPGSGNKAMFLAIFLIYEYERTKENHLLDKINAWFEFHNETQNRNGFWGKDLKSHYLHGLQNGLHQLVIYFYWQKEIPKFNRIIDITLMSQDKEGFFAPTPGGEACHDYDAVHILAMAHKTSDYRTDEIEACLSMTLEALTSTQNSDGGFCQSKYKMTSLIDFFRYIPFYFSNRSPYLWYYRARNCLRTFFKQDTPVYDWAEKGRSSKESNLWDTWFRCLTLAEIMRTLDSQRKADGICWRFHKTVGLGYF
jgi:prenyltransferase beta subunit